MVTVSVSTGVVVTVVAALPILVFLVTLVGLARAERDHARVGPDGRGYTAARVSGWLVAARIALAVVAVTTVTVGAFVLNGGVR